MADEPKPVDPKKEGTQPSQTSNTEATASDLLSLWSRQPDKAVEPSKPTESPKPIEPHKAPPTPPVTPKVESKPVNKTVPKAEPKPISQKKNEEKVPEEKPIKISKKEEAIEGEIVSDKPLPKTPSFVKQEEQEDISPMDEFLQELNISRKQIYYGIGCIVFIIILVIGGIFGYKLLKSGDKSSPPPKVVVDVKPPTTISSEDTGMQSSESIGNISTGPLKYIGDTGIKAVFSIGMELIGAQGLAQPILLLRKLQNAYATDVDDLLNKSTDRRASLDSHLSLLRNLDEQGKNMLNNLKKESSVLLSAYQESSNKQSVYDANFFDQVKALNAQTSENILNDFVEVSKKIVALRARIKAIQKVQSMYESALPKVEGEIKEIDLNREALVAGIKVYKMPGSNLNLVIPIEDPAGTNDSFNTQAFPLLPIHPSQVKTEHDYITQPGGI